MENTDTELDQTTNAENTATDAGDASDTNQSGNAQNSDYQMGESTDSGEENNTQSDDNKQSNGSGIAQAKDFNELAQDRKTLWQQERERAVQIESQMQNQVQSNALTPQQQLQQWGTTASDIKINRMEQEQLWDKAYSKHPELQKDADLDQLVYGNYVARKNAGEDVTPLKIADEVMNFIEKRTARVKDATYKQAENDISEKILVSPKNPKRSPGNRESSTSELKSRARAGDESAMNELLSKF